MKKGTFSSLEKHITPGEQPSIAFQLLIFTQISSGNLDNFYLLAMCEHINKRFCKLALAKGVTNFGLKARCTICQNETIK